MKPPFIALLRQFLAARSIVEVAIRPLKHLTEQANSRFSKASEATTSRRFSSDSVFRRPRRILTWVLAKIADRDLVWRGHDAVGLGWRLLALLLLPLLLAMDTESYRFHRKIEGAAGWTEIEVPDDVFDAARPGLSDLRIVSETGEEIPYIAGGPLAPAPVKLTLFDVEQSDHETTALADRGADPPRADAAELELAATEFIKPVTLEVSADRAVWSQIARGSIFATPSGARMTRLHFAPNDRRYWRFRFDDRQSPPLTVARVVVGLSAARETPPRIALLALQAEPDNPSASVYAAVLPTKNLPLRAVRVRATDAAFVRRVRVFERVWFRDEVSRRLLGEGDIRRSGAGEDRLEVPLTEPTAQHLEIEIDRAGGVPLHGVTAEVVVEARALRFHAPKGSAPELVYGSNASAAPAYDLTAALRTGPASFASGKLGPVTDSGRQAPALPAVARGAAMETAGWKTEQPIVLPAKGSVAYFDLERGAGPLNDVRIVDQNRSQVPYVVESEPRRARIPLTFRVEQTAGATSLHLEGTEQERTRIDAIEVAITSPEYFERDVHVFEQLFDARGKTNLRQIGNAHWLKVADQPAGPLRVALSEPHGPHLTVQIADGDNVPLVVASLAAEKSRRRVNFVFNDGDELRLLSGNDAVSAPKYDLALLAAKVISSPAEAAQLGPSRTIVVERKPTPAWFWIFVLAAAVILLLALGRTLTQTPGKSS